MGVDGSIPSELLFTYLEVKPPSLTFTFPALLVLYRFSYTFFCCLFWPYNYAQLGFITDIRAAACWLVRVFSALIHTFYRSQRQCCITQLLMLETCRITARNVHWSLCRAIFRPVPLVNFLCYEAYLPLIYLVHRRTTSSDARECFILAGNGQRYYDYEQQ